MAGLIEIKRYYDIAEGNRQIELYNYWKGIEVPVNNRQAISEAKKASHTNLHVDFFGDIVDLKVGYVGQSITATVNIPDDETKKKRIEDELKKFNRINSSDTKNSESIKMAAISGKSHRLCYTDGSDFMIKNIPGWSVVYDYDQTPLRPKKAYYFYSVISLDGSTVDHCDVYDDTTVTYYISGSAYTDASMKDEARSKTVNYVLDSNNPAQTHNFKEVPIIPIYNNMEGLSDCENSVKIMDLYDEIISDTSAEVKAMRLAYLIIYGNLYTGLDADGKAIDINTWIRQTSTMNFPASEDGKKVGGAEFLEKNLNDTIIENVLNRLRTHIYEISGSIDLKELANTERVFSIKAQLMRLENTSMETEKQMRNALYKQTRLHTYWLREFYGLDVDEIDIDWVFVRTFPRDLQAESATLVSLSNAITLEDSLKQLGWPDAEQIAARKEAIEEDLKDKEDSEPGI